MPLTDAKIRGAKAAAKPYRLTDGGGLHLYVTQAGGKLWRMRYEFEKREKLLSFGAYPLLSLAEARERRDETKRLLRRGVDPSAGPAAAAPTSRTFEEVAREWHALQIGTWTPTHAADVLGSLERDAFPDIGKLSIADIDAPMVLAVLRKVEARKAVETAHRLRQRISAVFVFNLATTGQGSDPAAIVKKALAPVRKGRQPALTELEAVRGVLRAVDATPAHPVTRLAMRLLALTVVRPGCLVTTPWPEIAPVLDEAEPVWTVPAARLKLRQHQKESLDGARDHLIPLSRQAVETWRALQTLSGRGPLAFPNTRHAHKPMSENAIGYLLNRAGYHSRHVPHGWRASFSTIMNERHRDSRHVIDMALAHVPKDKIEGAYNRALYLDRRRHLLQEWADVLLEGMPAPAAIIAAAQR